MENEHNIILNNLTEAEKQIISEYMDISSFECKSEADKFIIIHAIKGIRDTVDYDELGPIQTDKTLTELSNGNVEVARLLIAALERDEDFGDFKDEILNAFLFENKDPNESMLQKNIFKQLIKGYRTAAGYGMAENVDQYINEAYAAALEKGDEKSEQAVYQFLKDYRLTDTLPFYSEKRVILPIEMLREESREYLKYCEKKSRDISYYGKIPRVTYDDGKGLSPYEMYIVQTENIEHLKNGKPAQQYEDYSCEEIRKCFEHTVRYGCTTIVFLCSETYSYYAHPYYKTLRAVKDVSGLDEQLNALLPI